MILIVDDNRQVREMIRSVVADLNKDFCECEDGAEALANFQIYQPDWVLMDIAMKEMDGLAATRQIIARFPKANIAIVTSYDDDGLRHAAKQAGASDYFIKENLFELRRLFTPTVY
jgi:CheY-like chemotaxis protein